MELSLGDRTEETVRWYFAQSQQPEIKAMLPQEAKSVDEAVEDFYQTILPGSTSYGRTIIVDGRYVGDVWCYCMDTSETPNAMVSFCVFEQACWRKGIASEAVSLFLREIREKFGIGSVGAFTFSDNIASQRILEKNGFHLLEEFVEDGRESKYYQRSL